MWLCELTTSRYWYTRITVTANPSWRTSDSKLQTKRHPPIVSSEGLSTRELVTDTLSAVSIDSIKQIITQGVFIPNRKIDLEGTLYTHRKGKQQSSHAFNLLYLHTHHPGTFSRDRYRAWDIHMCRSMTQRTTLIMGGFKLSQAKCTNEWFTVIITRTEGVITAASIGVLISWVAI